MNTWVERVQSITDEQAEKEGMPSPDEAQLLAAESGIDWYQKPRIWFKSIWDRIYGNWQDNPFVWCIEFEIVKSNVDTLSKKYQWQ